MRACCGMLVVGMAGPVSLKEGRKENRGLMGTWLLYEGVW
jgi:hypothetical protein